MWPGVAQTWWEPGERYVSGLRARRLAARRAERRRVARRAAMVAAASVVVAVGAVTGMMSALDRERPPTTPNRW